MRNMIYNGKEMSYEEVFYLLKKEIEYKNKREEWEKQDCYGLYVNSPDYEEDRQKIFRILMKNAASFITQTEE